MFVQDDSLFRARLGAFCLSVCFVCLFARVSVRERESSKQAQNGRYFDHSTIFNDSLLSSSGGVRLLFSKLVCFFLLTARFGFWFCFKVTYACLMISV